MRQKTVIIELSAEEEFYLKTDKKEREAILDEMIEGEGMTPENEIREKLWELRYEKRGKDPENIDYYIRGLVLLTYMERTANSLFGKRQISKDVAKIDDCWRVEQLSEYGELGQELYFKEIKNMVRLYIELCKTDRSYSSVLLGFGKKKEGSLTDKISADIYRLAYAIPKAINMVDHFAVFTKAATEAYDECFDKKVIKDKLTNRIKAGEENESKTRAK